MLTFEKFEMLDVVGPLEAFATAAAIAGGGYGVEIVSAACGTVRAASGLSLETKAIGETMEEADTLLVSGGIGVIDACGDARLVKWLVDQAANARRLGSVCSGALLLAEAGLLDGRRAATHWKWCDRLAAAHPRIAVDRDSIFVRDGRIWTSAGVTAGIDMALAMIEEDRGSDLALAVARELVVYLKRPGGQAQFSVELQAQNAGRGAIRAARDWIVAHPEDDLGIDRLAELAHMSNRNFSRVFLAETGRTPGSFVETVRVERACRLLESTGLSIEAVAGRTGFRSGDVMRRAFLRLKSITPGDYRERFGGAGRSVLDGQKEARS